MVTESILEVNRLNTSFFTDDGEVPAVSDVSFYIQPGEILGVVGESGCGKSVTSLSVMDLIPRPGKIVSGNIKFKGEELTKASQRRLRQIRGNEIAMIFQEPMTSLNPVFTIGSQLIDAIRLHNPVSKKKAAIRAVEMLKKVGMPRAEQLLKDYPHQLSGGMRQRVMIAMAMACEPDLLIADEPTTALDVTIQAQILDLMKRLNDDLNTSILLITHDLGVVADVCDRIVVMYAGKVVEEGSVRTIFNHPQHPYTEGLIRSVPNMYEKRERLYSIPGNVPKPGSLEKGCLFAPRCPYAFDRCTAKSPQLLETEDSHQVRCFLHEKSEQEVTS
ncbi:MAG TPA: ABC transporter ATP-binding protein [Virgibacillus sp.]|nr:ABC transporter ATP-binding protein [Virgibacillus sp.]